MKNNKSRLIVTTLLCLAPILLGLALYSRLPDQIPTHWGSDGQVNGYSSKTLAVFGLPAFFAFINAVLHFSLNNDPKGRNITPKFKELCFWLCPILSVILMPVSYFWALGRRLPVSTMVNLLVGVLIICIGNYLPKCKQNYTSGIKLPWTLNDEENWNKTHHMAGPIWMLGGVVILLNSFWAQDWLMLTVIGVMVAVPAIYSYCLFRKKEQEKK